MFVRVDLSAVAQRLYEKVIDELESSRNPDYTGVFRERFKRLVLLLIRFCQVRTDSVGSKYSYLRRFEKRSDAPLEFALQDDLATFLIAQGEVQLEKTDIASGRADIYLPQPLRPSFRFIIEIKRLLATWTEEAIGGFLRQTTAYQQTDLRLGFLAALDLSDRPAGFPHLDNCVYLAERQISSIDVRHAVIVRVPGNRRTPSDDTEVEAAATR
jgi:hypothetical protein